MRFQDLTSYLVVLIPFVAADSVINEGLRFRQKNSGGAHCHKNSPPHAMFKDIAASSVEYMRTPNFDIIFLSEENSNPMWKKYADLFQPIDPRYALTIQVSYGNDTDGFRTPSIRLNRSEVESVLATLGSRKHMIVMRPRNCKPHYTRRLIETRLMNEFKNEFLQNLLQQQHEKKPTQQVGSDVMDPIVKRILEILHETDQKMIDYLKWKFGEEWSRGLSGKPIYSSRYCPNVGNLYRISKHKHSSPTDKPNNKKYDDRCNEGYVFLLQNQHNSTDPNAMNDLILRVLRIVTESS